MQLIISENNYPLVEDGIYKFLVVNYTIIEKLTRKLIVDTILYYINDTIPYPLTFCLEPNNKRLINFLHSIKVKRIGEPYIFNPDEFLLKEGYVRIINNYPVDFIYIPIDH
jgi:hypothetical protein